MPIYEYACDKCGENFEITQRITEEPLKKHNGASKCGGKVRKLMSFNSFHLKGSGWYKTDYSDDARAKLEGTEKPADKVDGKGDKKPAEADAKKTETAKKETNEKVTKEKVSAAKAD